MITINYDPYHNISLNINGMPLENRYLHRVLGDQPAQPDFKMDGSIKTIWTKDNSSLKQLSMFVYEEPPKTRSLTFDYLGNTYTYNIITPYMLYFILFSANYCTPLYVFFRKEPLESVNDTLYFPALPNVYLNEYNIPGKVCIGNMRTSIICDTATLKVNVQASISSVISDFWASAYNVDILAFDSVPPFSIMSGMAKEPYDTEFPPCHTGMKIWEKLTLDQILALPFHKAKSFNDVKKSITEEYKFNHVPNTIQSSTPYTILSNRLNILGISV